MKINGAILLIDRLKEIKSPLKAGISSYIALFGYFKCFCSFKVQMIEN